MLDDLTFKPLIQCLDDTSEALKKRFASYHKDNIPIVDHYNPLGINKEVNANQKMQGVWEEIVEGLPNKK